MEICIFATYNRTPKIDLLRLRNRDCVCACVSVCMGVRVGAYESERYKKLNTNFPFVLVDEGCWAS